MHEAKTLRPSSGRAGFTLTELMITVVIIGLLASVAIPSMAYYIYKSYASEATGFLGQIRMQQESYLSEYGQYCNVSDSPSYDLDNLGAAYWTPTGADPPSGPVAWPGGTNWSQLGASADADVRFQYTVVAGPPGSTPTPVLGYTGADYWFVARARGDLDGDSTDVTFEAYSGSDHIWCSQSAGWD